MANSSSEFIIKYVADVASVLTNFQTLKAESKNLANTLAKDFKQATGALSASISNIQLKPIIDPKTGAQSIQTIGQLTASFKDAGGKISTFTNKVELTENGLKNLGSGLKEVTNNSKGAGINIAGLAARAALTIPVWLALRAVVTGAISSFTGGFRDIESFDLALQRVKRNLQGTPQQIESDFKKLRQTLTDFSIASGISTDELADSVKEFATLGFNLEDSLSGGLGAAKLATVLFGDASETADAFAGALNILIDRSAGAKSATEQMNEAFALTAELGINNKDSIKGTAEGLKNFGSTAKALGLSMKETLVILATLSSNLLEGAKGGTLASSAFNILIANLHKVSGVLGISVNPNLQSTTELFISVIDEIDRLGKVDIQAQTKALNDLFGGLRGTKAPRALLADLTRLKENFKVTGDVAKFNAGFLKVTDTISGQTKIFHNLNKEIGKAFVTGIVGGDDFLGSLRNINSALKGLQQSVGKFASDLRIQFESIGFFPIVLLRNIEEAKKQAGISGQKIGEEILKGIQGTLSTEDLTKLIIDLQAKINLNPNDKTVSIQEIAALRKKLQEQIQKDSDKKIIEIQQQVNFNTDSFVSVKEQQDIGKIIIQNELDKLKSQGASTAELSKQEDLLNDQFKIYRTETEILKSQLDTQKALSQEQRLQNKLGSDSVKLFQIAQTNGVGVAQKIGDVLSGNTDFSTFIRQGGEAVEVFKKQFNDIFENQQAQAFFKGETVPGVTNLRGGSNIAIQEQAIRGLPASFNPQAQLALNQAQNQIPEIRADIKNTIAANISIDIQGLSFREAVQRMKQELSDDLKNPQSQVSQDLDQHIEQL